ncbi:hypothetical protein [Streptomyces sp. NPDC057336]|uniref:hypothetical protein n=1 Tax=Streptomyces sp. NPDC057336 TaxID=3346102 RepID=UPI00364002BD
MTPADELRTAAEKIRTHAEGAATGPWTVNGWGNIETANSEGVAEVWPLNNRDHNAAYVAAMHPGVGTALAKWLESWVGIDFNEHAAMAGDLAHALAVARQINGSAP